jgi:prevent-host-death family protein
MDKTVGAFEAKTHFSQLLERTERGEEIVITKRGRAVARLIPIRQETDAAGVRKTLERMKKRAMDAGIKGFEWTDWKHYRDDGRR